MRIVIDMQGAQSSGSRNRGIGRYTLWLVEAMVRQRGEHEVVLALNGSFLDSVEALRAHFAELLPPQQLRVWQAPGPTSHLDPANTWRRKTAELLREAFLASLRPDMVLVTSLFEGWGDDTVTSIGLLGSNVPTASILYDLIPLIHRTPYLDNPDVAAWYEGKLDHMRRADLLLAISDSSRQEGLQHLGFGPAECVAISTATDACFVPKQFTAAQAQAIRQRHGLARPFVMYTGGIDHRKNIEGLIRAYAMLSPALRTQHQLAIVCAIQPADRERLGRLATAHGLGEHDVVFTGFVTEDDLLALYNLCKLFVFPSWHEGFGLPALEAMACGRAVIGANTSSVPEVIGRADALFDPHSDQSIADKMTQVLCDGSLRADLEQHGLAQSRGFTWEASARRALDAMEAWHLARALAAKAPAVRPERRPRLAYVSPLPPERSGISDYSAELLPELARHYEIEVIVAQAEVTDPWVRANCPVRSVEWFQANAGLFDRVLYHFGNSSFHQHMFELLDLVPGVVVLHDFFLSGIVAHMDVTGYAPGAWANELYRSHGYAAVRHRHHAIDTADVVYAYPCNQGVLAAATGLIVHSNSSVRLAATWSYDADPDRWRVIPHLRTPSWKADRQSQRQKLGYSENSFVVCSFGMVGATKLNHRLLDAWLASKLSKDPLAVLVFVGENNPGHYGNQLLSKIRESGLADRVRITGWADGVTFKGYLEAADMAVQLRALSRGETSGTVLDCMNHALPTIVNANGSMADLPADCVWRLQDDFTDAELVTALETLWRDEAKRRQLGISAQRCVRREHAPRACAAQYAQAIESSYAASAAQRGLIGAFQRVEPAPDKESAWVHLAAAACRDMPQRLQPRQLLVDVSELVQRDARAGIQRVVRNILATWLEHPPQGLRVEPVYATAGVPGYRYARRFTLGLLDCPPSALPDDRIEVQAGDIFLALDLQPHIQVGQIDVLRDMRMRGVTVKFVVYDLLPLLLPDAFVAGAADVHQRWLGVVAQSDGAICISQAVAAELTDWLQTYGPARHRPFEVSWFHLGADPIEAARSAGLPPDAEATLASLSQRPSVLMVGTLEPRKGHAQALAAFEELWASGVAVNLVIVGRQGWMVEELVQQLQDHGQRGRQLFWLDGISDAYLDRVYEQCDVLLAASSGEGFGLPLIEAAQRNLPILARSIPAFTEVAGDKAAYFEGDTPTEMANAIAGWLTSKSAGAAPLSTEMPWMTWKESAAALLDACEGRSVAHRWLPDRVLRFWGGGRLLSSQVGRRTGRDIRTDGKAGFLVFGPYVHLPGGRYSVRLFGSLNFSTLDGTYVDVAVESGTVHLAKQDLSSAIRDGRARDQPLLTLEVDLDRPYGDLEVRIFVTEKTQMTLDLIEISPQAADGNSEPDLIKSRTAGLLASEPRLQAQPKGVQRSDTPEKLTRKAKRKLAADSVHGQPVSS
jgi:glycosyltransferase involved in cell wall biosynthesis